MTRLYFLKPSSIILFLLILMGGLYFYQQQDSFLQILQANKHYMENMYREYPLGCPLGFFILYVIITSIAMPGIALLTMAAGWIFPLMTAILLVSFAGTLGATFSFLFSRQFLREWVQQKFKSEWKKADRQFKESRFLYLFSIRLIPAFPFFLSNWLLGLTSVRIGPYIIFTQLGMLPATVLYAYAGRELSSIHSVKDIFSPFIVAGFVLLALFPWVVKTGIKKIRRQK